MITEERFRGGEAFVDLTVSETWFDYYNFRCAEIRATTTGKSLLLPYAPMLPEGGPLITLYNLNSTQAIAVKNFSKQTLFTIPNTLDPTIIFLYLVDNSTSNGTWRWYMRELKVV